MKYLVTYKVGRYLQSEDGPTYAAQGGTMVVEAESKAKAFIAAYERLVQQGDMVETVSPWEGQISYSGDIVEKAGPAFAGLTDEEMQEVYKAGVPQVSSRENQYLALTRIEEIRQYEFKTTGDGPEKRGRSQIPTVQFVDSVRLNQLGEIRSESYDLTKLLQLCGELNRCYSSECFLAVAMLVRAILDHVPPIFGCEKFVEVANNYNGTLSFKASVQNLENSSRKIADAHLHTKIRRKETVPTQTQVNFANDLDVLLSEIVRLLK